MTSINASLAKYALFAAVFAVLMLAKTPEIVQASTLERVLAGTIRTRTVKAASIVKAPALPKPSIRFVKSVSMVKARVLPKILVKTESTNIPKPPASFVSLLTVRASAIQRTYLPTPPENYNLIEWIDLWQTKERRTASYLFIIDAVLATGDYPNVNSMLIMGIIAQETGGDPNAECNDFDTKRGTCAVGLMALSPSQCGVTEEQLKNATININCGTRIINTVIEQAIEKGFRPGRDAIRAALGAYNCSWASLLADRCYWFGGWMYADKINNYWIPLLNNYLQGEKND